MLLTGAADTDDERRATTMLGPGRRGGGRHRRWSDVQRVHWWSAIDGYEGWAGFDLRSGLFDRDRNPTMVTELGLEPAP